ncbi:DUF2569 family protein [Acinetobacter amyesii]
MRSATDTESIIQLATSTIGCLIWTPYLLMSVRVKILLFNIPSTRLKRKK